MINVSWNALANATSYNVIVRNASNQVVQTIPVTNATSTRVNGLAPTAAYTVTVTANNGSVDSQVSTVASVTTVEMLKARPWAGDYNDSPDVTSFSTGGGNVSGSTFKFTYEDAEVGPITVTVDTSAITDRESIVTALNNALQNESVTSSKGTTLADLVKVEYHASFTDPKGGSQTNAIFVYGVKKGADVTLSATVNDTAILGTPWTGGAVEGSTQNGNYGSNDPTWSGWAARNLD